MPAEIMFVNPRRKRRHKKHARRRVHARRRSRRTHARRRRHSLIVARKVNPRRRRRVHAVRHHRRRRVRNPRFSVGGITRQLVPAAIGGVGAIGADIALGYATPYLPSFLTAGYGKVAAQVGVALGLGFVTRRVLKKPDLANSVVMGALTVAAYSLIKTLVKQAAPTVPGLSGSDYMSMPMGAYMQSPPLGYVDPAPTLQGMDGLGAYMPGTGMSDGM